jgi:hypothetical protein
MLSLFPLHFNLNYLLLLSLLNLLLYSRTNARTALPLFFLCFTIGRNHCGNFLSEWLIEKQSPVADNIPLA